MQAGTGFFIKTRSHQRQFAQGRQNVAFVCGALAFACLRKELSRQWRMPKSQPGSELPLCQSLLDRLPNGGKPAI